LVVILYYHDIKENCKCVSVPSVCVMNHILSGAALGSISIVISRLMGAEIPISIDYYLLIFCFGSGASVIYTRCILKI